jgi:hypothetical protein
MLPLLLKTFSKSTHSLQDIFVLIAQDLPLKFA